MDKNAKADLHIHSSFSNKPAIWAMRKINCPESFTKPEDIYKACVARGMDFITITDHNSVSGCLEILKYPNTFISAEITTHFPDSGCKAHVVTLDLKEGDFDEIIRLRKNIFDMTSFLRQKNIAHFLAHPLYDINGKLTPDIFEKFLLLFNVFEVKNGGRDKRYNTPVERILYSLDKATIERLADKHQIEPHGDTPWIKGMTGGSDDHSGFLIANSYTVAAKVGTVREFISEIMEGRTWAEGEDGSPLTVAHAIYGIAFNLIRDRLHLQSKGSYPFLNTLVSQVFANGEAKKLTFAEKVRLFVKKKFKSESRVSQSAAFEEILDDEAKNLLFDREFLDKINSESTNRKIFAVTRHLANRIIYIYTNRLANTLTSLNIFETMNSISSLWLAQIFASPYYIGYYSQRSGKRLISDTLKRFSCGESKNEAPKVALFTDTLHEINGVAITIKKMLSAAKKKGISMTVITCSNEETGYRDGVMNFKSVGEFAVPEYPELKINIPPILDIIDYFDSEGFTHTHVSTPGSVGLMGLVVSRILGTSASGTYHTDIPGYVSDLTNDHYIENAAWGYMMWFYGMLDEVTAPSESTRRQLIENGLAPEKIKILRRWVDARVFSPEKKDPSIWEKYDFHADVKFIYVGRVSKEKNLSILSEAFRRLLSAECRAGLIIVGDGPYREELQEELSGYPALFTGFQTDEELYKLYASADVFVFPSATDTFGNVVLEAQSSGLPVIVSDEGGPRELMMDGHTGVVVKAGSVDALCDAMKTFMERREMIEEKGNNARLFIEANAIKNEDAYDDVLKFRWDDLEKEVAVKI